MINLKIVFKKQTLKFAKSNVTVSIRIIHENPLIDILGTVWRTGYKKKNERITNAKTIVFNVREREQKLINLNFTYC